MEFGVTKEEQYNLWLMLRPMWSKWAYKMSMVDNEKSDWEQESYIVLDTALRTYEEGYAISFNAYYRMLLYRYGKKVMNKPREVLVYEQDQLGGQQEIADTSIAIEDEVVAREWEEEKGFMVRMLLAKLTPRDKELIEALYLYQKPITQFAKEKGTSYDAIECRKRRVLKKLKSFLQNMTE